MKSIAFVLTLTLPTLAQTAPVPNHWTVLVYGGADNDSEESFCPDMAALQRSLPDAAGFEVFCLVDRSPRYSKSHAAFGDDFTGTRLYQLARGGARRLDGGEELPELRTDSEHEMNTGDGRTLRQFLRWAKANHPAAHYALVFYTHGNGSQWCPDETDADDLAPAEISAVLGSEDSVALAVFDVCDMAGLPNAYQWRPAADRFGIDVMVATPMSGFPFPWPNIVHRIGSGDCAPSQLTAARFGAIVVEETEKHRRSAAARTTSLRMHEAIEREAMACLDLSQATAAKAALDALAQALGAAADGDALVAAANETSIRYGAAFVDAFDLASRLRAIDTAPPAIATAAAEVQRTVDALVLESYGQTSYDARGGFRPGQHGVWIVLPDAGTTAIDLPKRIGWYCPDAVPVSVRGFGHLADCRDGATAGDGVVDNWFELLVRRSGSGTGYRF